MLLDIETQWVQNHTYRWSYFMLIAHCSFGNLGFEFSKVFYISKFYISKYILKILPPQYSLSVQFSCSVVSNSAIPWTAAHQASLSITNSGSLPKPMSIESVMPSNHLILCRPLLLLPSVFPSIRVFCNESALRIKWPKYWSFSFNISPSNEHPGLISFYDGMVGSPCSPRDS